MLVYQRVRFFWPMGLVQPFPAFEKGLEMEINRRMNRWMDHPMTCMWLITMVGKSPKDRVVGPLPNGRFMVYTWALPTTYTNWDDPPSKGCES